MLKRYLLILSVFIFAGWGSTGHKIINSYSTLFLPDDFSFNWSYHLGVHASDADYRKSSDPDEGPRHYIDIDNYQTFVDSNFLMQNYDSVVAVYGLSFVISQGTLPWTILWTVDSLKTAFEERDFNKALLLAADLGHYLGDAHMPLHLTRNYNGQFTGQSGIHSRYESTMINKYSQQIIISGDSAAPVGNLEDFVFNFIYDNYEYVDSVLAADIAAKNSAGNTSSDFYYQKLWEESNGFTKHLFNNASEILGKLILTAWRNAGSPTITTGLEDPSVEINSYNLYQNYPNPFNPTTKIKFIIPNIISSEAENLTTLKIYDLLGNEIVTLVNEIKSSGEYEVEFKASNLSSGIYFYQLKSGSFIQTNKMILMK